MQATTTQQTLPVHSHLLPGLLGWKLVAYESLEEVQTAAKKSVKLDHDFPRRETSTGELAVPIAVWMQCKSSALCVHS